MEPIDVARLLLLLHAALGAFDTFYSHEWVERLPRRPEARRELAFHAWRSAVFVALFTGAAWIAWHGVLWVVLPLLIAAEFAVTLYDSVEEDRYRVLKPVERVTHMLLGLNTGCYLSLIAWQAWVVWRPLPSAIVVDGTRVVSWLLTLCAGAVLVWAIRDGVAARGSRVPSRRTVM